MTAVMLYANTIYIYICIYIFSYHCSDIVIVRGRHDRPYAKMFTRIKSEVIIAPMKLNYIDESTALKTYVDILYIHIEVL